MKLGIMQPYLFPYIGYFQLINHVERWIAFDDVQYISKGWVNRNRIIHPDNEKQWQYITVPAKKHSRSTKINEIEITDNVDWKSEIIGKLSIYKKKAPNYSITKEFVEECLSFDADNLSDFIINAIRQTCAYVDINTKIDVQSEMGLVIQDVAHPGQWALKISEQCGASEYVNPYNGASIFAKQEFDARGIKLRFLKSRLSPYIQRQGFFTPGLSIIDVLMWNDHLAIKEMLNDDYDVFTAEEIDSD